MKNIPSPHGGPFGRPHHQGALVADDEGHGQGRCHGRRRHHGHGHGHDIHGHRRSGRRYDATFAHLASADRDAVREVLHLAQDMRNATSSLLHRGSAEQLAETRQLLQSTRRELYLILAGRSTDEAPDQQGTPQTTAPLESAESLES